MQQHENVKMEAIDSPRPVMMGKQNGAGGGQREPRISLTPPQPSPAKPPLGNTVTVCLALLSLPDPIHSVEVPAESESKLYSTL